MSVSSKTCANPNLTKLSWQTRDINSQSEQDVSKRLQHILVIEEKWVKYHNYFF